MRTNRLLGIAMLLSLLTLWFLTPGVGMASGDGDTTTEDEYILFAPLGREEAYLIDRSGEVVHRWALSGQPGNSVYLLEGGDLLATYTVEGSFHGGGIGGGVERLTWDGEPVWSFELATETAHLHHDVEMLPNGNVLMIAWEAKSRREARAAGLSPDQLPPSGVVWSEMILEYSPSLDRVVWDWRLWDHALPAGWDAEAHPGKIDLGFAANRNSSDWWHLNAVDYHEALDQIVVSSRAASEIWILDHSLTTAEAAGGAGDLLYRFGNPAAYGGSESQVLYGQHNASWIEACLDPAGPSPFGTSRSNRILLFDNGDKHARPTSRVVELDLPDYENGLFEDASIIWQYPPMESGTTAAFFADHISGAQRLENGNTLLCIGTEGRFLEVTPEGTIVWEYVNPFTGIGPGGKPSNEVFRAEAYTADYIGRDSRL